MSSKSRVNRRIFLQTVAATVAAAALGTGGAVAARRSTVSTPEVPTPADQWGLPFLHGVASGDPLPDRVVLWTRVTPSREALPGSGLGDDIELEWQIDTNEDFTHPKTGSATASAESDHTVHVDPDGLDPDTEYFYRFIVKSGEYAGASSPIGRTLTAPAKDADVDTLNLAIASCANWESGFFSAYADMAQRARAGEIDHVVFLGDYIYEYPTGEYVGKSGVARMHHPEWEITTLEDYRQRYGRYRTDLNLQAAHAACPWIVVWDDHESANNSWREGAENHTDGRVEGKWAQREAAAMQAYYEWLPVRRSALIEAPGIYRSFQFGNLAQLTMMDLRTFRDEETTSDNFANDERTMLGDEQFAWVAEQLQQSTARWDVLGNSVMVSPMRFATIPDNEKANIAAGYMKERATGIAVNSDQWDGYAAERDRLLTMLDEQESNALFLTGDIHSEWANSIASPSGFGEIGCEMVTTSISAPNVDEILTTAFGTYHKEDNSTSLLVEQTIRDANPWVSHIDFDAHGYGVASIHYDYVDMLYYRVSDVEDPDASVSLGEKRQWRIGEGFVEA
ncbi:phosphodiesterase [Corynebacterium sp. HMSC08F01]|uniref:alkaline phosphatase D family protein n=1 Tax=Corynebacterium TaxID=1716 RepID=UPI0008A4A39E|nr:MULTISPECIES: alkaline phosphatase D family protein [Corynebacterium]MDK8822751.1 alkaline phosphatase D family protein [Corynebacterium coyleae]OFL15565.1 phosphodiesterase [Corynebacterium sp. HMSC067D03]OFT29140.1 phosphodiesterase [Corynebacterium sp. HMSC08F01]OFT68479.1 phosphodiesterase [Corynebacterium sp. HMSC05C01]